MGKYVSALKRLRLKAGFETQHDAAKASGQREGNIANWERGNRGMVAEAEYVLANAYRVHQEEIHEACVITRAAWKARNQKRRAKNQHK